MLLAIRTTQVRKAVKKKQQKKVTKNLLQEDSNPDLPNKLELDVTPLSTGPPQ